MKYKEISGLSDKELKSLLVSLRSELHEVRLKSKFAPPSSNKIRLLRLEVARILTAFVARGVSIA